MIQPAIPTHHAARQFLLIIIAAALLSGLCLTPSAQAEFPSGPKAALLPAQERGGSNRVATQSKVPDRSSRQTAKARGDITFDDLKFDIEPDGKFERDMLTEEIEALNKKKLRIRGYILPASVFKQSGIKEFVLVRDNMECCFGPGAALYDCIMIKMEEGKSAEFTTRPVAVRGKFEIEEFKFPDGTHYAIYKMTATEVK